MKFLNMICEMCGSEDRLYRTKIEGTEMNLCSECSRFGKVLGPVKEEIQQEEKAPKPETKKEPEVIEMVMPDFSEKIRKKREQLGLDHEKFAKMINQKKSVVHKLENKELTPNIKLAKRLEKILNIQLVEEYAEEGRAAAAKKTAGEKITIGDIIKVRKRRK